MKDEGRESTDKPAHSNAAVIVWVALGLGLLTFCGGKTDDGQSTGGAGGNGPGGDGYAGHTAECLLPGHPCGGPCRSCPDQGGFGGEGGFSGDGFAGHTAQCLSQPCGLCGGCQG